MLGSGNPARTSSNRVRVSPGGVGARTRIHQSSSQGDCSPEAGIRLCRSGDPIEGGAGDPGLASDQRVDRDHEVVVLEGSRELEQCYIRMGQLQPAVGEARACRGSMHHDVGPARVLSARFYPAMQPGRQFQAFRSPGRAVRGAVAMERETGFDPLGPVRGHVLDLVAGGSGRRGESARDGEHGAAEVGGAAQLADLIVDPPRDRDPHERSSRRVADHRAGDHALLEDAAHGVEGGGSGGRRREAAEDPGEVGAGETLR